VEARTAVKVVRPINHDGPPFVLQPGAKKHAPLLVSILALELEDVGVSPTNKRHGGWWQSQKGLRVLVPCCEVASYWSCKNNVSVQR
jgi:hypothetical protein